jgi:hypothetical protein
MYTATENFFGTTTDVDVDTNGAAWVRRESPSVVRKFEVDQFTDELKPTGFSSSSAWEPLLAKGSPFAPDPLVSGNTGKLDIDYTDNDLYLNRGTKIETYSQGNASELAYKNSPSFGEGNLTASEGIAVTADHHVYAGTGANEVAVFGPGDVLPDPHTYAADIEEVGHTGATVHGQVKLGEAGGTPIVECKFQLGTSATNYSLPAQPCTPDPASAPPGSYFNATTGVDATFGGLNQGTTYHYRVMAKNEKGENFGIDRTFTPAYVLKLQTLPASEIEPDAAKLNASFDPDGMATEYKFQYGVTSSYGLETDFQSGGSGSGITNVGTNLTGLPSGTTFHYRVVAKNVEGQTIGADKVFRTASSPGITGVRASEVTADSAVLSAAINPNGYETEYAIEYGTTPAYGQSAPASPTSIGDGTEAVEVNQTVTGLQVGITYHYRVVATNAWGTSYSPDTTFDYAPPTCPNAHVRQQTTSAYLPDCRAYELVSPESAGAAILMPSHFVTEGEVNTSFPYGEHVNSVTNRGFATSPSRFTYFSAISTIEGSESPIGITDMYMATRTNEGWVTKVPGLTGETAFETARKECSESMDLCADRSASEEFGFENEASPYIYTADGQYRGRLPTNVNIVKGGKDFFGGQRMSGDFSYYAFSSSEYNGFSGKKAGAIFAQGGLADGIGSAYGNDIAARTVNIISKAPNGDDILVDPAANKGDDDKGFDFPGMSPDGSHVLMQTPANTDSSLVHLFMRVDDMVTYAITNPTGSHDADVEFLGMTRDGDKVLFITTEQLIGTDLDNSADLYMWKEGGANGTLSVISQGSESLTEVEPGEFGPGNRDDCSVSWGVSGCGVKRLTTELDRPGHKLVNIPGQDDLFAERSGDVYFYSPENLDSSNPGIKNQRNLYLFRNGALTRVATMDTGTEITRMQISPDGSHAAMLTASKLTGYDTKGFEQVYTLDPESGDFQCASCKPSGLPPSTNAVVSQGGRFMSDDGRTFFSSKEGLVPRDQNGTITDTYEFVDGRPQLISSGLGGTDYTGGAETLNLFLTPQYIGLEHVSHDGTDVYVSTFETLVANDFNGAFVKFYDARSGGGFPREPELAPCAAADECHGPDSSAPAAPTINSGTSLGDGGNVVQEKTKKKKSKKGKKKGKKGKKGKKKRAHHRKAGRSHA